MRFPHFFIDRPIFAAVLSIFITIVGGIAYFGLPVSQYPQIAPPTVTVTAAYPGANAELVAETVAAPLEQEINGVDGMIYMTSQSTGDGRVTISVAFRPGTNVDDAQVLVQNRVSIAEPRLPEEVRRLGVVTRKASPDLLMVIFLVSTDDTLDRLYVSNYAIRNIRDVLARVDGVGNVLVFGAREYAMRVWLDPDKVAARGLTAGDVVAALRSQNLQISTGVLNQPPVTAPGAFEVSIRSKSRLAEPAEFGEVILRTTPDGGVLRLKDVARIELGGQDYSTNAYLSGREAVAIAINERPGSNAIAVAGALRKTIEELGREFPSGMAYDIAYNPTEFVEVSIQKVYMTIYEAMALVVVVVLLFLQSWRAAIIPIIAIPVSLIGTFAFMALLGFSLNTLSLFGLILAIGIVVDDAIVVVENVERNLQDGMSPKEAAHKTMDEVGSALLAIALVLSAVFIPTAFITGISGAFYQQFAVTISVATLLSCFVSLTLSPAMAALLLRPHAHEAKPRFWQVPAVKFFRGFNRAFDALASGYGGLVRRLARVTILVLVVYAGLLGLTGWQLSTTPTGFIPAQDRGYAIVAYQLPSGASLGRTDAVVRRAQELILATEGVQATPTFAGFSGATFTNAPNAAATFVTFKPFEERVGAGLTAEKIVGQLRQKLAALDEGFIIAIPPPAVSGIGTGGGFKMMVQDRAGLGAEALFGSIMQMMIRANQMPEVRSVFSSFEIATPQLSAEIDRSKAEILGVPVASVYEALSTYVGSTFVNEFNLFGRSYRVTAQADYQHRLTPADVADLKARNRAGDMVPLGAVATFKDESGPYRVPRHNLYPAAELQGETAPGISSTQALAAMEKLAAEVLPPGIAFEWTELAYQQKTAGNTATLVFLLAVLFVFLVLAAQYESLALPFAVILIVPMCILAGLTGVVMRGFDNNIITQIGFVVLVGLAAKNAILIVEFARDARARGVARVEAAVQAGRLRLRPILMTSLAFILGVVPLVTASGAGAEIRQVLGTVVFAGMIGVTAFGLIFTPVFFIVIDRLVSRQRTPESAKDAISTRTIVPSGTRPSHTAEVPAE